MKELFKEYQTVLITSIASMFVFICVYALIPIIVSKTVDYKPNEVLLDFIKEDNSEYDIGLKYPKGQKIRILKGENFDIGQYIKVTDKGNGEIENYKFTIMVDGKSVNDFNTNTCGGFYITTNIYYKDTRLNGELLVIIEER